MRPIDRHEDAIVAVMDLCDLDGWSYLDALDFASVHYELSPARLAQLVRLWCALAGVDVPV